MSEGSIQKRLTWPRIDRSLSPGWARMAAMLAVTTLTSVGSAQGESSEETGQPETRVSDGASDDATQQPAHGEQEDGGPSQAACLEAHKKAQAFKRNTQFIEANEQLLICSRASCPGIVIADCGEWLGELDRRTPSLAFSVKQDGREAPEAQVTLDGEVVSDRSQVFKVNPGRHVVRIKLAPFASREEVVFARDGAGTQVVRVEFATPADAQSTPVATAAPAAGSVPVDEWERPVPVIVYPLAVLSAAGFAGFAGFAYIGNTRQNELEDKCEPECDDDQLKPMKNAYLIGDISLAVGAASLLGAAITYWTRPKKLVASVEPSLSLQLQPTLSANATGLGVSAVHTW